MKTLEEMKATQARLTEINSQLSLLIADEEALNDAINQLRLAEIKQMQITLNLPTGEAMVASFTTNYGERLRFESNSDGSGMLNAMIAAGIAHAQQAIESRKTELQAQL